MLTSNFRRLGPLFNVDNPNATAHLCGVDEALERSTDVVPQQLPMAYDCRVSDRPSRILVIEPDKTTLERITSLLSQGGFLVDSAENAAAAESAPLAEVDLILVDLAIPDVDGVDFIRKFAKSASTIPIVILAKRSHGSRVIAAIRSGARGCLFVNDLDSRLVSAVKEALDGGRPMSRGLGPMLLEHVRSSGRHSSAERQAAKPLTEREQEVLQQLARGLSYDDIGKLLGVSVNTVRSHVRTIYEKFEVNSRTEAVLLAMKLGLVKRTPYPMPMPRY